MGLAGIAGRIALVTGAARRRSIGRAVAFRLAREGADVACLDIARPYAEFPGDGVAGAGVAGGAKVGWPSGTIEGTSRM